MSRTRSQKAFFATVGAAVLAGATALSIPAAQAQPAPNATPTLKLNVLDRNMARLQTFNAPNCPCTDLNMDVFNGDTKMQPILDGTERGYATGDAVYMDNLKRGATYNLTVRWTSKASGQVTEQTNSVTVSTPPSTDTQPPTAPTNIRFYNEPPPSYPNYYGIGWDDSKDNVDSGSDIQYVVKRNGSVTGVSTEAFKGDKFTVTAIDKSNNATTSTTVTFDGTTAN